MQRYFFNIYIDGKIERDKAGAVLTDKKAVWDRVMQAGSNYLRGNVVPGREWRMHASNEMGETVFCLELCGSVHHANKRNF